MRFLLKISSLCLLVALAGAESSRGGTVIERTQVLSCAPPFQAGTLELSVSTSALTSTLRREPERPSFVYLEQEISLGIMLYDPRGDSWYRGNLELLISGVGAEIVSGPGSYLVGGKISLRYNFVQPDSKWIPFFEVGAGGLGTDAYKERRQRIIGREFEFLLVGNIGVRYMISPRWAIVATARFEHISNADSAKRNLGVNAVGGGLGFSRFF